MQIFALVYRVTDSGWDPWQDLINARNNPEACILIQEMWFSFILE
jgi:hypothetical protein